MPVVLQRLDDRLPEGFAALRADAEAGGHGNLGRLALELSTSPAMFHGLVAARVDGVLAGIGAVTDEPAPSPLPAWRMRRFHVHSAFRRRGIARAIAADLIARARGQVPRLTVHAGDAEAARFWEAMGFHAVAGEAWSHELDIATPASSR